MVNYKYRYLGYGETDENGRAKLDHAPDGTSLEHSYTGVGRGKVDVVASLKENIEEWVFQSETSSIWDTIAYFDGTVNNHFEGATETIVDNGVHLTSTNINNRFKKGDDEIFIPTDNDFCIEFYVINQNQWVVYLSKIINTRDKQIGEIIPTTSSFKNIKYEYSASNQTVKQYIDSILNKTTSDVIINDVSNVGLIFVDWQKDLNCIIKDLKVYPI